jgi:hypothetical protein
MSTNLSWFSHFSIKFFLTIAMFILFHYLHLQQDAQARKHWRLSYNIVYVENKFALKQNDVWGRIILLSHGKH